MVAVVLKITSFYHRYLINIPKNTLITNSFTNRLFFGRYFNFKIIFELLSWILRSQNTISDNFVPYNVTEYSRMDKVTFVEYSLFLSDMVCFQFKFFEGCISQILLGPFLDNLFQSHFSLKIWLLFIFWVFISKRL